MRCEVTQSEEFASWFKGLREVEQDTVTAALKRLELKGVDLRYPKSSGVHQSKHGHMRELRIDTRGEAIRVFYAFDPRRKAVVLVGGRKRGEEKRFYREHVRRADAIYDEYLRQLRRERGPERDQGRGR
jgi:hypothetical protein